MSDEYQRNLIWLASYPKSGNTWVRLFFRAYLAGITDINERLELESKDDVIWQDYEKVSPVPLEKVLPGDVFFLRPAALYGLNAAGHMRLVKTHCANRSMNVIPLIPGGLTRGALYIVRDPRDVAVSYAAHLGVSVDDAITEMAQNRFLLGPPPNENLAQYASNWSDNAASWTRGELAFPVLVLKYEDMPGNFGQAVRFIGEELDEDRLAEAIEAVSFENVRKQEDEHGFVERPPHMKNFFRAGKSTWREVLTKDQVARIEGDHGETMQRLGYALGESA